MNKNISTLIILFFVATNAWARIPIFAFKDVNAVFLDDQAFYSPTLGLAALDSGLIYNLRYYGDYHRGLSDDNSRKYISDSSDDNLWNLVKILFPSQGGAISPVSSALTNLGKHTTPETVALLLNYAFITRNNFTKNAELLNQIISSLNIEKSTNSKKRKWLKTYIIGPLLNSVENSISDEKIMGRPAYLTELVLLAFFVDLFSERNDIKRLLTSLDDRIVHRAKINSFMIDDVLSVNDLESALTSPVMSPDQAFLVMYQEVFTNLIPYRANAEPAEMVTVRHYDRTNDKFGLGQFSDCVENSIRHLFNLTIYDRKSKAFNINNLKEYAESRGTSDNFNKFEGFYEVQTPAMVNTNDENTRSLWNKITGDLNNNNIDDPQIAYLQKTNELDSSFVNIINVLKKVFGLETPLLPKNSSINEQQLWVEASMIKLLKIIDPNREYEVSFSSPTDLQFSVRYPDSPHKFSFIFHVDKKHSNIRDVRVEGVPAYRRSAAQVLPIKPGSSQEVILLLGSGYGEIVSNPLFLIWPCSAASNKGKAEILQRFIDNYEKLSIEQDKFFEKSMIFILGDFSWSDENAVKNEFMPLSQSFSKLASLKPGFSQLVRGLAYSNRKINLTNIFKEYPNLEHLWLKESAGLKIPECAHNLKTLHIENSTYSELSDFGYLDKLKDLKITGSGNHGIISFVNLKNLIFLDLSFSNIHIDEQGLEGKEHLQKLTLKRYNGYGDLSFIGANNLRYVDLSDAKGITSAPGLSEIKTLEYLNLTDAKYFSGQLEFDELSNLHLLKLRGTNISSVKLSDLPQLTELNLEYTPKLKTVELRSLANLQSLYLSNTAAEEIDGLDAENLGSIQHIDLSDISKIKDKILFLHNFLNLQSLLLKNTPIEHLGLYNNPALKSIDISFSESMSYLSMEYISNLKKLSAFGTGLKRVDFYINSHDFDYKDMKLNFNNSKNLNEITGLREHFDVNQLNIDLSNTKMSTKDIN